MPLWPAAKLMDSVVGVDVHAAVPRLQEIGLSALGARQALQAQPITSAADRDLVARIPATAVAQPQQTR